MKIAFVHDWLVTYGGAEQVLEALLERWPGRVYALVHDPKAFSGTPLEKLQVTTSFIQKLPLSRSHYRYYLPLFPLAVEQFDLSWADLVLSISTCVAKGVLTGVGQYHLCYCCTPMRYAWDLYHQYMCCSSQVTRSRGFFARAALHYLRIWDQVSAQRVDRFITLSSHVARRIERTYGRKAVVIPPPVKVELFSPVEKKDDYYVVVSRLVPYKRVDIVVRAFCAMPDRKLIVVGDGPEASSLRRLAGPNIQFAGRLSFPELKQCLQRAKALIHAAEEDFGIVMVEAHACATPVLAYGKGGALDIVSPGETGFFFNEQTPEAVVEAVERFEALGPGLDPEVMQNNAKRFGTDIFLDGIEQIVMDTLEGKRDDAMLCGG